MRAILILITGVVIAAWTVIGATSLANVSTEVSALERPMPPTTSPSTGDAVSTASPSSAPLPSSPSPTASATPTPSPVAAAPAGAFVLGDSISLSIAPALSRLGYPVTGKVGQSVSSAYLTEHLSSPTAQQAPAWVIVLGTNNAGDADDVDALRDWVRTIRELRTKGAKQDVFWVTPHRPESYRGGMSSWTLEEFNTRLHELAADRDWLTVLDFAATAVKNAAWFEQDGQHLHPDERGQQQLVQLIAGADADPAPTPAPITTIAPPTPSPTASPEFVEGDEQDYSDVEFSNE